MFSTCLVLVVIVAMQNLTVQITIAYKNNGLKDKTISLSASTRGLLGKNLGLQSKDVSTVDKITGLLDRKVLLQNIHDLGPDSAVLPTEKNEIEIITNNLVETFVEQVFVQNLLECYFVVVTSDGQNHFMQKLTRRMVEVSKGIILVELSSGVTLNPFLDGGALWGNGFSTCVALVLQLSKVMEQDIMGFLEDSKLKWHPDISVLILGEKSNEVVSGTDTGSEILLHPSLINVIQLLYFAIDTKLLFFNGTLQGDSKFSEDDRSGVKNPAQTPIEIYRRCLFCNDGQMGVKQLRRDGEPDDRTNMADSSAKFFPTPIFSQDFGNFKGRTLEVVTLKYFPYTDYTEDEFRYLPADSLDTYMMDAIAQSLNCSYEIEEPPEKQWGVLRENGTWTGIVGALERNEADLSFLMSPTEERRKVLGHSTYYSEEAIVILTSKPKLLPQHLALIRPLTFEVWIALMISLLTFGISTWTLQRIMHMTLGASLVSISTTFIQTWGALFMNPHYAHKLNAVEKILSGLWLTFCLIITYSYKSSLIAHLTVQGRNTPIDSFEDLERTSGWTWGAEPYFFTATSIDYFQPGKILDNLENHGFDDGMRRVLQDNHAFVTWKQYIRAEVAARFTDSFGNTPFHMSRRNDFMNMGYSWGFRKGAPFAATINLKMQRLIETGHIDFWLDKVMERHQSKPQGNPEEDSDWKTLLDKESGDTVVLNLDNLQGAFYLLALGMNIALSTVILEFILGH